VAPNDTELKSKATAAKLAAANELRDFMILPYSY
jgi:hypothetical protein